MLYFNCIYVQFVWNYKKSGIDLIMANLSRNMWSLLTSASSLRTGKNPMLTVSSQDVNEAQLMYLKTEISFSKDKLMLHLII
jgi:hypothetical protein